MDGVRLSMRQVAQRYVHRIALVLSYVLVIAARNREKRLSELQPHAMSDSA